VTVGIAPTKTLAKMANRYAKKKRRDVGVYWAANNNLVEEMLRFTEVGDIWGIGRQYANFLVRNGFKTAFDLIKAPEEWIRKKMTVQGQRLLSELKGIPAIEWEFETPAKKNICTSRSFGKLQTDKNEIKEALCNYAATCALKLRQEKSCCKKIHVFVQTNPHKTLDKQYLRSINVQLERASNNTGEIVKYALKGFDIIFKEGYNYLKCGIIVMELVPENKVQGSLFSCNATKTKTLMDAMDKINRALGKDTVRACGAGF
jgi:DNA polymerase V